MKQSIPLLHSYRSKSGGASVHVIRPKIDDLGKALDADIRTAHENWLPGEIGGYALVIWGKNKTSSQCFWDVGDKPGIHTQSVPEVVRDTLARRMAVDSTKKEIGAVPPDDGA